MSDSWPLDVKGNPLAKVSMGALETIGLPNYSNVKLEGSVTRFVEDNEDAISQGLQDCVIHVERVIAVERDAVIEMSKAGR